MRENEEYCHGFFGSTALLCQQEHQYMGGRLLTTLRSSLVHNPGLVKLFLQPHLLFCKAIGDRCIV